MPQESGKPKAREAGGRRLPIGAEPLRGGGVHFRVWAPAARAVDVVCAKDPASATEDRNAFRGESERRLDPEPGGYHSGLVREAAAGTLYLFRLDGGDVFPDPASRFQPAGRHGPSQVIDPETFAWTDDEWRGLGREDQVISELHVGTYTPGGTLRDLEPHLDAMRETGITTLELMPVCDFPGDFSWGYDGVCPFAPARAYGTPDDLRRLIDRAHRLGLAVILDVVYNHLGPDGNYLGKFSRAYFSSVHTTDWGEGINFDGEDSGPVREYFIANAVHWIREYHFDGLRFDATQDIHDDSPVHVLREIADRTRAAAAGRRILLVAENESQDGRLVRSPEQGGFGLDALWNDDFHHSAKVALLGRRDAYFTDYLGRPQEFVSTAKYGYLYQGQWYSWQRKRRGTASLDLAPSCFVNFLENHDQVANFTTGSRLTTLADPALLRAMTALLLLSPGIPLLFQGQEFGASARFDYFADHPGELGAAVHKGRRGFLTQFPRIVASDYATVAEPTARATFEACKLDLRERDRNSRLYLLHRDLLRIRRTDAAFRERRRTRVDGAVLGGSAFVLRYFVPEDDRLLVVNLGTDLRLDPAPEPLLAPPQEHGWEIEWSSEDVAYGGLGTPPLETAANWRIPGRSAVLLRPSPARELPDIPLSQEDVP